LREKAILAGKRIERIEKGEPGEFDKLSEADLDRLLEEEYRRIKELQMRFGNDDAADNPSARCH
jgi:hypothetical protein